MVTKKGGYRIEEPVPELDEGWWEAILADENEVLNSRKDQIRSSSQPVLGIVDWERIKNIFEQDEIVNLEVHGYNRGGLLVQGDGIQGFVPVSHLVEINVNCDEEERKTVLCSYVGRMLTLKVIECEPKQERIVLSERAALSGEGSRKMLFENLKPGGVVCGTVTNVTEFGVFIDLGGVEGLVHVSELSWGRVTHPGQICKIGDIIKVLILHVSEENSRIALSLKRLQPNPWELLVQRYKPGDVVTARISSITKYGAFARLDEGVEGLIHISSITQNGSGERISDLLQPEQSVEVRILHLDIDRRRLGLGLVLPE
ncbi:MAG: S1 RNA-binding domain-containing protein [Anaerolineaceae bacterium]|nr:S1 RNA-binding domain-containing protein [Anaerolineaceae bacterium]